MTGSAPKQQEAVQVEVEVLSNGHQQPKGTAKSSASLSDVPNNAAAGIPDASCAQAVNSCAMVLSSTCLWGLFMLGFVCPPSWWAGVVAGWRSGSDRQCLIHRRTRMTKSAVVAWWACVVMSILSAVAIILGCAIYFGQAGPEQEGPFFLLLVGPAGGLPDLSDPSRLVLVAAAVHGALGLAADYPVGSITVWLDSTAPVSPNPGRRLMAADAGNDTTVSVLGYSMVKTAALLALSDLGSRMDNATCAETFAQKLVEAGLVTEEHAAQLSVGLTSARTREALEAMLERKPGNPAFNFMPVGKRCKGAWTEWTPCSREGLSDGCAGSSNRTFIVPTPAPRDDTGTGSNVSTRHLLIKQHPGNDDNSNHAGGGGVHGAGPGQSHTEGSNNEDGAQDSHQKHGIASQHGDQSHGLAAAFSHGQGLALALGHVDCASVNNTVETRACTETCMAGDCAGMPASAASAMTFTWNCTHGTQNGSTCVGACNTAGNTAVTEVLCSNGTYTQATCWLP